MNPEKAKQQLRQRRQWRVRRRFHGSDDRPRLAVFRSLKHVYAQLINDDDGRTLAAASTVEPELRKQLERGCNKAAASLVGKVLAERAVAKGVKKVCFDRRHYRYHGRVAALAEAAREGGLEF